MIIMLDEIIDDISLALFFDIYRIEEKISTVLKTFILKFSKRKKNVIKKSIIIKSIIKILKLYLSLSFFFYFK